MAPTRLHLLPCLWCGGGTLASMVALSLGVPFSLVESRQRVGAACCQGSWPELAPQPHLQQRRGKYVAFSSICSWPAWARAALHVENYCCMPVENHCCMPVDNCCCVSDALLQNLFNHRFGPFGTVEVPQIAYYSDYITATEIADDTKVRAWGCSGSRRVMTQPAGFRIFHEALTFGWHNARARFLK